MAKILLVEDDKSLREIYGVRLMAEGYQIVSAGDGEEALAVAIKERPDLIVSDVMMPKISGFDMLDILRSTTETKDIKVIMMTALSSEDQRARGEALGADRYLVKSQVGIEDVVRTVHDVLGDGISNAAAPAPVFPVAAPVAAPVTAPIPTPVVAPIPEPLPVSTPAPIETIQQPVASVAPVAYAEQPVINTPPVEVPVPPQPAYTVEAPVISTPAPTPYVAPAPAPTPVYTPAPAAPTPAPNPFPPSVLPAPTAPFSSPRPASLGDRIINPLPSADNMMPGVGDIATQMNQELNTHLQEFQAQQDNAAAQPPQPPVQPPQPLA
jgi:CheY-like chemotaxis protein